MYAANRTAGGLRGPVLARLGGHRQHLLPASFGRLVIGHAAPGPGQHAQPFHIRAAAGDPAFEEGDGLRHGRHRQQGARQVAGDSLVVAGVQDDLSLPHQCGQQIPAALPVHAAPHQAAVQLFERPRVFRRGGQCVSQHLFGLLKPALLVQHRCPGYRSLYRLLRKALWQRFVPEFVLYHVQHPFSQPQTCGVQAAFDRPGRHLDESGNLLLGIAAEVEERGHDLLIFGQTVDGRPHALPQLVALDYFGRLWQPRRGLLRRVQGQRGQVFPARQAVAVLEHDAPEPGREGDGLSQGGQAQVSLDERFLGRILRQVEVAEQGEGIGVGHPLESADDLAEGFRIAGPGAFDQHREIFHLHPPERVFRR